MKSVASRALLAAALFTNAGGLAAAEEYLCAGQNPGPIVDRIRAALAAALEDQDTRARFLTLGMVPTLDTPEEFAATVRNQRAKTPPWQESST